VDPAISRYAHPVDGWTGALEQERVGGLEDVRLADARLAAQGLAGTW
jgi:hypothetical protein